jgi:hypothetical protein
MRCCLSRRTSRRVCVGAEPAAGSRKSGSNVKRRNDSGTSNEMSGSFRAIWSLALFFSSLRVAAFSLAVLLVACLPSRRIHSTPSRLHPIPRSPLKAMARTSNTAAGRGTKEAKVLAASKTKTTAAIKAKEAHSSDGDDEKFGKKRAATSNANNKKQKLLSGASHRRALGDISIPNPNIDSDDDVADIETKKQGKKPKRAMTSKSGKETSKAKAVEETATINTTITTATGRGTRNRSTVVKYCDDNDDGDEEEGDEDTYESDYEEKVAIAPANKKKKKTSDTANTIGAAKKKANKTVATASSRQKSAAAGTNAKASTKKSSRSTSTISILDEAIAPSNAKERAKNNSPDVISNFTQKFTRDVVGDASGATKKKKKVQKKNKKNPQNDDADSNSHGGEDEVGGDFDNVQGHERTTSTKFEEEHHYRAGTNDDWRCMSACDW